MKTAKKYTTAKLDTTCKINGKSFTWEFRRENGTGDIEIRRSAPWMQVRGWTFASREDAKMANGLVFA